MDDALRSRLWLAGLIVGGLMLVGLGAWRLAEGIADDEELRLALGVVMVLAGVGNLVVARRSAALP